MRKIIFVCCVILGTTFPVQAQGAQSCKFPVGLEKLAGQASGVVDINVDRNMLEFAGGFLNKNKPDEAQAGKFMEDIRYICVRSFQFDKKTRYAEEDIGALRAQFQAPLWSRVVGVSGKGGEENVDVFFRMENGEMTGMAVIAAESKELTFVLIDGKIRLEQLSELGGQFGIPRVKMPEKARPAEKETAR